MRTTKQMADAAAGLRVHRSNRTERLLAELAEVVRTPATRDPFVSESIIVQGQGMGRWLAMELSRIHGIWGHEDFPVMRTWLDRCVDDSHTTGTEARDPHSPDTLAWSIARVLPDFMGDAAFAPVARYLGEGVFDRRHLELAERIAETFDVYALYRPEMLAAWAQGDARAPNAVVSKSDVEWQARLWRAVIRDSGQRPLGERLAAFMDRVADPAASVSLPPRISVFGLSSMPPIVLSTFSALSRRIPVHLFVLSPTREFMGDVRTRSAQWREQAHAGSSEIPDETLLAETEAHPLLAAFGRLGRDFQGLLEERCDYLESDRDLFVDAAEGIDHPTALEWLQSDLLNLRDGERGDRVLPVDDASVRVNVAHSCMREVEILHDQLLDLFERDPDLRPHDIVVMSPDVERHAPFIDAVFGRVGPEGRGLRIPYRIADRSIVVTQEVVAAFLDLLEMAPGRWPVSDLRRLLRVPSIYERQGLAADDLARVDALLEEAAVRWGLDGAHRVAEGLPDSDVNTWRFGLDRMLLGVAMEPDGAAAWHGRAPLSGIEGSDAELVGRIAHFVADLGWARGELAVERTPRGWARTLRQIQDRLIGESDDNVHQHQSLRSAFDALAERAEIASFDRPVALTAIKGPLLRGLRGSTPAAGFLSGGVTFCEMVPMRSIPFEVVCILGLDDDAFPRIRRPIGFDLTARDPRMGDRTPRDDDRALFLESLLCARKHLLLSYVGRGVRDDQLRAPSIVVSELLDELEALGAPRDRVRVEHPLQPFSPRYFTRGAEGDSALLFSYDRDAMSGAQSLSRPGSDPRPFVPSHFQAPVAAAGEGEEEVSLDQLRFFFRHTARVFLREGLEMRVDSPSRPNPDREASEIDGLESFQLGEALLNHRRAGSDLAPLYERFCADGVLPPGGLGSTIFADLCAEVHDIHAREIDLLGSETPASIPLAMSIGGFRLIGRLDGIVGARRVRSVFRKLGGKPDLSSWIEHVAWCAVTQDAAIEGSWIVGRAGGSSFIRFEPPSSPKEVLSDLLSLYRTGRGTPLRFFHAASRKFVESLRDERDDPDVTRRALLDAYNAYGSDRGGDVEADADTRLVWGDADPITLDLHRDGPDGFRSLALRVFDPLMKAQRDAT